MLVMGTLGSDAGMVGLLLVGILGSDAGCWLAGLGWLVVLKIFARSRSACRCGSETCSGPAGLGCCSAWVSSVAACSAISFDDKDGTRYLVGKNSMVSATLVPVVLLMMNL